METEFDVIKEAPQYNVHPSGVEAIELCRHLGMDLGNAVKYLFRLGKKPGNEALQDMRKALYYLQDYNRFVAEGTLNPVAMSQRTSIEYSDKAMRVITREPDHTAKAVFAAFLMRPFDIAGTMLAASILAHAVEQDEEQLQRDTDIEQHEHDNDPGDRDADGEHERTVPELLADFGKDFGEVAPDEEPLHKWSLEQLRAEADRVGAVYTSGSSRRQLVLSIEEKRRDNERAG